MAAAAFVAVAGGAPAWAATRAAGAATAARPAAATAVRPAPVAGVPAFAAHGETASPSPDPSRSRPVARVVTAIPTTAKRVGGTRNVGGRSGIPVDRERSGPPVWLMSVASLGAVLGGAGFGWYVHHRPAAAGARAGGKAGGRAKDPGNAVPAPGRGGARRAGGNGKGRRPR